MNQRRASPRLLIAALVLAVGAIVFFHLWRLESVPRGVYLDEASIGLNAMTLAESGVDEHGEANPVYFRAMGEYKNPLYIYAVAALYKAFSPSVLLLRLTSALFFLAGLALFAALLAQLFPGDLTLWLYGLIALGFTPAYFNISRVSFEAISELPFLIAVLVAAHATFAATGSRQGLLAAITGLIAGVSVYSYSTNRLFSPLMLLVIAALYFNRERISVIAAMFATFAAALIPLISFSLKNPGALTKRFDAISYLANPDLGAGDKLLLLVHNYFVHFSPAFLLIKGDGILRHTPGTGISLWAVALLAVIGLIAIARDAALRQSPFVRLIVVLMLLSPLPSALTSDRNGHVLRSLPLSLFLLLVSCYGFDALRRFRIAWAFVALLVIECGVRTWHYFARFPEQSIVAFESAGFPEVLEAAFAQRPNQIRYSEKQGTPQVYSYIEFYRHLLHLPDSPPLLPGAQMALPNTCAIYFHRPPAAAPGIELSYELSRPDYFVHLRCYR